MLVYTGIGSRKTPSEILSLMEKIAARLSKRGWLLRSGGADGADSAFEKGCDSGQGYKEIFVPWKGFNKRSTAIVANEKDFQRAEDIAREFHPNWNACSPPAKRLHSRNVFQILGSSLEERTDAVICWTPKGKISGGTGTALRLALEYDIPIFNLYDNDSIKRLNKLVREVSA